LLLTSLLFFFAFLSYNVNISLDESVNIMLMINDDIDRYIQMVRLTVGDKSKRVYDQTYNLWKDWTHNNSLSPTDFAPSNVMHFLSDHSVSRSTRQRQLSIMRRLVQVAFSMQPDNPTLRTCYEILKIGKIPKDNLKASERDLRALNFADVDVLLTVWPDDTALHVRNRSLLAVLLSTGVRRAEAVNLRWQDINLNAGIVKVRAGKGDKDRDASFVGDYPIDILKRWHDYNHGNYVFPRMNNLGEIVTDEPMSDDNLYRLVKHAEKISGVKFAPHTMRRTLATELLAQGASIADVQEQLGHANPQTTLRYAKAADAQERRKRFKTRYGD
jgi:integrase